MNGRRDTTKARCFIFMSLRKETKSSVRSSYIERESWLSSSPVIFLLKSRHLPMMLRSLLIVSLLIRQTVILPDKVAWLPCCDMLPQLGEQNGPLLLRADGFPKYLLQGWLSGFRYIITERSGPSSL